jgi:hypothetical protein
MMKKLSLMLFLSAFCISLFGQTGIKGVIKNPDTNLPISGVVVSIKNSSDQTTTDEQGAFVLQTKAAGKQQLEFTVTDYATLTKSLQVPMGKSIDLGIIFMTPATQDVIHEDVAQLISESALDDDSKTQSISGLLSSRSDVFSNAMNFNLSSMFINERGYDSKWSGLYMNGVNLNDVENGRIYYGNIIGGLSDATRNKEDVTNITASSFTFGEFGGSTNIAANASAIAQGTRVSLAVGNSTYQGRLMATYATGLMKNGWAFAASVNRRFGKEGYVDGTFYDTWAYYFSAEKKFDNHHSLSFITFGAPTNRGKQSSVVEEVYNLVGTHTYNPNWGYQNGKIRNAREAQIFQPLFILNHKWDASEKLKINSSLSYRFGDNGQTYLDWYNAPDPRPDYYQKLPSNQVTPEMKAIVTNAWQTDPQVQQLDWNSLYRINYQAKAAGQQAQYIVEKDNQFIFNGALTSSFDYKINSIFKLNGGLKLSLYKACHYKTMDDLMGGTYWLDIDKYSETDASTLGTKAMQNDLNAPNVRITKKGQRFGYDYDVVQNDANAWMQISGSTRKFDFYAAGKISGTNFYRYGHMLNGRDTLTSYGLSPNYNYLTFAVKGGFTYKINGRNFLYVNGAYQTNAPTLDNLFIAPRISAKIVPDNTISKAATADITYAFRYPWLSGRITAFQSFFWNQIDRSSFYDDYQGAFVDYALYNMNTMHQGVEAGLELKVTTFLTLTGAGTIGNYIYTNRPNAIKVAENALTNGSDLIYNNIRIRDFKVPTGHQTAGTVGANFFYNYYFLNVNANYVDNGYYDFNPERRTPLATVGLTDTKDANGNVIYSAKQKALDITQQAKLKGGFTLDVSIGKSLRIAQKYQLNLNFGIDNILNNTSIQTGGYEQSRFNYTTKDPSNFPTRAYYAYGRTYSAYASFRF